MHKELKAKIEKTIRNDTLTGACRFTNDLINGKKYCGVLVEEIPCEYRSEAKNPAGYHECLYKGRPTQVS